jgi:SmpA / OmlA family
MKLLVPTLAALMLSAASLTAGAGAVDRFAQIHPGLTQDEVRSLAGGPNTVTGASRSGETLWIYSFTDTWGYRSEFDVTFDKSGHVAGTSSERLDY